LKPASFLELFTPKLVTVLREGYGARDLRADAIAGLTVAIVALPLSMAIAIASGVPPDRGILTAIVGGFLVSALGGSRFQIGGPAGAFIVLVSSTVARHGVDGLVLATMLAGIFLLAIGFFRLGTYVKFIPYPVTIGFTAGIAVIILASQLRDLLGLTLTGKEPGELIPKLMALGAGLHTINGFAVGIGIATIAIIQGLNRFRPAWPSMLIAIAIMAIAAGILNLPVETIGTRFGNLPRMLPAPSFPEISLVKLQAALPDAIAFCLLGAIESLLSAVVADGMTGRRHRSNCELVAQGVANIGSALFGGMCVTGTIARTATNVRAGSRSPISGILHSVFLLLLMLVAAPLASFIPLAALAAVLVVVAWNMAEKHEFTTLLFASRGDALVLLSTFLLTIFRDLTEGILVGFALGAMIFINRMSQIAGVESHVPLVAEDRSDGDRDERTRYDADLATDPEIAVYRITGAFFFGAASTVGAALDRIDYGRKSLVIDFAAVPYLDSTAAKTIAGTARIAGRRGVRVFISGANKPVTDELRTSGIVSPLVEYVPDIRTAVTRAKEAGDSSSPALPGGLQAPVKSVIAN
jgi:SulP family sulfate permease